MLTIATINPKQAEEYYQQENYYSKGAALENSEWFGRGAAKLGLSGEIADNQVYKNLVNGLSPDGKQALRGKPKGFSKEQSQAKSPKQSKKQNKQSQERAGVDLTFSAPKSVSLACLVGGEKRLEEAHRRAVIRTLEFIEKYYPQTRIKKQRVKTDNLTVALWHHDTSRELDPHLHTHCILMNFTALPDGRWQSRTDENLYFNKMLLGQIYRQELANECRALGYEIEPQPKELFEIKGYTRQQIEAFSKRHEQIVKYLEEREIDVNTESKVWAWRRTRVKKNHEMGRNEKLAHWHEEAELYSIVHPTPVQEPQSATTKLAAVQEEKVEAELQKAIGIAIEHCKERKVAFEQGDILKFVTAQVNPFGIDELEQAIPQHPELIKTYNGRYTTQTALATELATINLMQQGKGVFKAIALQETIDRYLADKSLTSGQREAIALSATSTDQFIAWQGVAGAGKTYVLSELKQLLQEVAAESNEITLLAGYAPSKEATKVLGLEVGIQTNTVASLLLSKQPAEAKPNQLWIVDEAGMLSAKDGYALLQRATAARARVILVGDTRQLSAVEAGNPFKSLQQAGISTAYLNQSLRQKVPDLQHAASLAAAGDHLDALQHLESVGRLTEVCDLDERNKLIAGDYLQLSSDQRETTLVLVGTHKEKAAVMQHIREGLKQEGTLLGEEAILTRLKQKDLTKVQARYQHNYNISDVVVPLREYKRAGLFKDRAYAVCDFQGDKLVLSDWSGNQVTVDPMKFRKNVYTQQEIAICVGEQLKWIREDKQNERSNRDEFTVTAIEGRTATIRYHNGREESLYLDQPLPLDYAIASTTYSSQGKTADRVLISSTVDATVSQESIYVAISRAKYDLKIYAENIDYLLEQAQESKAQETVWDVLHPSSKVQASQEKVAANSSVPVVERPVSIATKPKLSNENSAPGANIERPLKRKAPKAATLTPQPILKQKLPKQLEVFWQPNSDRSCPPHIEAKHWHELVEGSAIHPDIAALNFRSLQMGSIEQEHQAWEYLMYSDKLERTNTGQLTTGYLKRYAHIEAGGWWCNSGANALSFSNLDTGNKPQEKIWGCYKPNQPRSNPDKPGKVIKYEHPPKTDLGIFLLDVPDYVAQKIYARAGVDPSQKDRDRGFWYCVWKHNLPVIVTEGAKKAASLLSQGHAAIGLPGIYAGYRSKDEQGNPIKAHLHEELAVFATLGRSFTFCFDFETRLETKQNIEIAISRTGSLLRQQGAKVNVVSLSGPEKGVDDLIVAQSPLAFEQELSAALPLQQWREVNKQQRQIAFAPPQKLSIEQRKQRLKDLSLGQPPIHDQNLNQSQEQISDDDIEQRQSNDESAADARLDISQSHALVDQDEQESRSIGENQLSTECEARPIDRHWQSTEQTDYSLGERTNRELERIESQPPELSYAISRHSELQKVEQLGADITELDRSLADGFLSNQGTEQANQIVAHQEQLPQQLQQTQANEHFSQSGEHDDGRHTGTDGDRQINAEHRGLESPEQRLEEQHGRLESPEPRSIGGQQGTQELQPQTVRRDPIDSQADAQRLHRPVQSSLGATEIGQTERSNPRIDGIDEQSLAQAGGHQTGSNPSQGAGDVSLRGDYQPAETNSAQREEVATFNDGQWTQALGELAQNIYSVNDWQAIASLGLERQLTALAQQLNNLDPQPVKYEFTGLSELAQSLSQQQSQSDAVENLEQIQPILSKLTGQLAQIAQVTQEQVVDEEIAQARRVASALTSELQPGIEKLAGAINQWQSQAEVAQAIASVAEIVQQLEQRHTFDFGNLPQLLNEVTERQQFRQSGLDTQLATLTQQLKELTPKAPTVFEGMSALAENLQALQAESQLLETGLTEKLNAMPSVVREATIAELVANCNPQAVRYNFDDKALGELAQKLYCLNTEQQLLVGGALEQLCQTANKVISAISQHNEQLLEDLSMPKTDVITKAVKRLDPLIPSYTRQNVAAIANQVRDIPLEEVAVSLGLTRDKRDKHKWRKEAFVVSINEQKFTSTWLKNEGGVGAISFVLHVWGKDLKKPSSQDFIDAVNWLSSQRNYQPIEQQTPSQPKIQPENKPFQPPVPDERKWHEVRQYLVEKRGLPAPMVDKLHSDGKLYAVGVDKTVLAKLTAQGYSSPEKITNAVFLRHDLNNKVTGASLRGVADNSLFKGLSTGSQREGGWFSFTQGEGELKRIVLVESAIDALSAAALSKQPGKAMFVSTDGAGSVPVSWLRQQQQQAVEVVAAHDSDRPGEEMAWRLAAELGAVTRATPAVGKDWNEHLLGIESQPDVSEWKLVAQAIGKPDAYIKRIEAVVASGQGLPIEAEAARRQDFDTYRQTSSNLWQWHQSAKDIGKSDAYLRRITEVAIAFHHPKSPTPLPQQTTATMQQDLAQHEQVLTTKLWQHYSRDADPAHPMKTASIVACGAAKDGYSSDKIRQILLHDPALTKIRGRSGEQAAQNHLKIAMRLVNYQIQSTNQSPQNKEQQLSQQKPGLEL